MKDDRTQSLIAQLPRAKGPAPVHLWNPPFCGDIEMRIARDGSWFYQGTPIQRPALVQLFAGILKREGDAYFLVTPVEKVGIRVDDAPFVAIDMDREGEGSDQRLQFTTNIGDRFTLDGQHALRVPVDPRSGEPSPYLHVRDGLEALVHRNLFYRLVEMAEVRQNAGRGELVLYSAGEVFSLGFL